MAKYVQVDLTKAPEYILLTFAEAEPSLAEFQEYLQEMEQIYQKYQNFVLLFDGTKAKYLSSELRSLQSEWIKKNTPLIQKNCLGMVYILPNIMVEIIFKCIVKFSPLPVKYATVRSLESSFKEAEKLLKQKQIV